MKFHSLFSPTLPILWSFVPWTSAAYFDAVLSPVFDSHLKSTGVGGGASGGWEDEKSLKFIEQEMLDGRGHTHIVQMKIGNSKPMALHLIPDTSISELTIMSE